MKEFFQKLRRYIRYRTSILIGGSLFVVVWMLGTDPDPGSPRTIIYLQTLMMPILAVWFAYIARKALFDYLDMEKLYSKSLETATGAALTFLGICLIMFGLLGLFGNTARAETIPVKAPIYLPLLKQEQIRLWVSHPKPICLQVSSNTNPAYLSHIPDAGTPPVD